MRGNRTDKKKPWKNNKHVVNDGVVYVPKSKELAFHLSNAIYATKKQEVSNSKDVTKPQYVDKPKKSYQT